MALATHLGVGQGLELPPPHGGQGSVLDCPGKDHFPLLAGEMLGGDSPAGPGFTRDQLGISSLFLPGRGETASSQMSQALWKDPSRQGLG